ncbi:MFS general substrate transporter [Lojkania enalia]|uniref:MFS general substrate transporter n=1 Tax=Lojkania enalia TaxID=147567 RepID=A0A9P4N8U1_9PLEO|nr:MFS general substrate transporter [Didymosphaeria enalia]
MASPTENGHEHEITPEQQTHRTMATVTLEIDPQRDQTKSGSGPPPNGDLKAWLQVALGFMPFFNAWGILNTFGVYQAYYEPSQLFSVSSSEISWIGSLQSFFLLFTGAVPGSFYDHGHLPLLLILRSILVGLAIGIGSGCLFVPAVATLPTYLTTKVTTAIGIAASGSSICEIIYPIVFYRLIPRMGYTRTRVHDSRRSTHTHLVMQMRVKPPKARVLADLATFKDVYFFTFILGSILGYAGLYVGIFYLSYFGLPTDATNESLSFYLVAILNVNSVFGRTLPNVVAEKIGPFNVLTPGAMILSIILFCLIAVDTAGGLIVSVILFRLFSGVFIALPPVCFASLTEDKGKLGTRIGMGNALIGFGILASGPGSGVSCSTTRAVWTGLARGPLQGL